MKKKGYLLEDKQGGKTYMEDIGKMVTEVARKAFKEFLENLMDTERDAFLMENNGQKNGY